VVLSGNTSVSNFSTSSSFRIWKSIGRGYSSWLSQVFGLVLPPPILLPPPSWSSSCCSVTATSTPLFPPPKLAPYCSPPAVDFRWQYKNLPRLRPSFWPSLMPFWHTHPRPLIRVSYIHYPILPLGTASFPGTTPPCRSTLSLPSSG